MQQLATGLLTSGDDATNFTRYSELASVQQKYLQQMGALWVNSAFGSVPMQPAKGRSAVRKHDDTELCDACERSLVRRRLLNGEDKTLTPSLST